MIEGGADPHCIYIAESNIAFNLYDLALTYNLDWAVSILKDYECQPLIGKLPFYLLPQTITETEELIANYKITILRIQSELRKCEDSNSQVGLLTLINFLSAQKIDINYHGIIHLIFSFKCYKSIAHLIANHHVNLNQAIPLYGLPLFLACRSRQTAILKKILDSGADVNAILPIFSQQNFDYLAMQYFLLISDSNQQCKMSIELLINKLKIIDFMSEEIKEMRKMEGKTALHLCAIAGYHNELSILLSYNPDDTIVSDEGKTALEYALQAKHEKCAELLVNYQEQKLLLQIEFN